MDIIEQLKGHLKVLYVEDEEVSRIILKKILRKKVEKIYTAKNGIEGLELFKEIKPDILITDLRMPYMDGMELISEIRTIDKSCGIIIMTEVSELDYILKSIDIGIDKYLVKPICEDGIVEALNIVVRKMMPRKFEKDNLSLEYKLSKEEKNRISEEVKSKISTFYKKIIGKGPKYINVVVSKNSLEINIHEALTYIEQSLMENVKNRALVEYNRNLLYETKKEEIRSIIEEATKIKGTIESINIDLLNAKDKLIYKIDIEK